MGMNKVILIGGNHHNGLGLVRSFGRRGIKPYGIIIGGEIKRSFVAKSKYWSKKWVVSSEDNALQILKRFFLDEEEKPVIITWSDGAAELIDKHFDELKEKFLLPSINSQSGKIIELMNKESQISYSNKYGIKMLPSYILQMNNIISFEPQFPIIFKPVSSIEGDKNDMYICHNIDEYTEAIENLRRKKFDRILCQTYMPNRTEYVVTGAITNKRASFTVVRHIRQWPLNFGTGSFSIITTDERILEFCEKTLNSIKDSGYEGLIDFELFESETGDIYLNEINWRSSGRNFISKVSGVESSYMYYCDKTGIEYQLRDNNTSNIFSMNEVTDIKHVFNKDISLGQWLSDLKKTKSFAVWDASDPKPALYRYSLMLKKMIGRDKIK